MLGSDGVIEVTETARLCPQRCHSPVGETDPSPGSERLEWSGLGWRTSGNRQSPEGVPEPTRGERGLPGIGGTRAGRSEQDEERKVW